MSRDTQHSLIAGARTTSLGTLASRLLGMLRDVATASLLGMSSGGVMDAFAIAFRIPNLFRRLFGEGALATSYLPVLAARLEEDRQTAWRLVSVGLTLLTLFLVALVLAAEGVCGLIWLMSGQSARLELLLGLTALLIPYLLFLCLAAQISATLHALGHFATPAWSPLLLNLCWLIGAWGVAPYVTSDEQQQAYVLAVAILVAGLLQLGVQIPILFRLGFRFDYDWPAARASLIEIVLTAAPLALGLAVTQINVLLDSLIAWTFAATPDSSARIAGVIAYPLEQGAAAAVYYGERLYQFPQAILGLAVATAIYPLLSRHAARGENQSLADDLTLGLRMVMFLALPASVGLLLLARPITELLFEHGRFSADDTRRTARMIGCYAMGVWAYCALPVIVRGYYALSDRTTPVRVGMAAVGVNLILNLTLIWPFAESGLALATTTSAIVQVLVLAVRFSMKKTRLDWSSLAATTARSALGTLVMAMVVVAIVWHIPPDAAWTHQMARVLLPLFAGGTVYFVTVSLLDRHEIRELLAGRYRTDSRDG